MACILLFAVVNEQLWSRNYKDARGCDLTATYYLSLYFTDFNKVHDLWAKGNEIGVHSITVRAAVSLHCCDVHDLVTWCCASTPGPGHRLLRPHRPPCLSLDTAGPSTLQSTTPATNAFSKKCKAQSWARPGSHKFQKATSAASVAPSWSTTPTTCRP